MQFSSNFLFALQMDIETNILRFHFGGKIFQKKLLTRKGVKFSKFLYCIIIICKSGEHSFTRDSIFCEFGGQGLKIFTHKAVQFKNPDRVCK